MIHLARHGQTAYNHEGRFQGHLPVGLDETGIAQAHALADQVAGVEIAVLWCSPLHRARQTADIVAAKIGLAPREDARFVETDTGDWTDLTYAEVRAAHPEAFDRWASADPDFAFPGGESFREQIARVADGLDAVRAEPGGLPALVVCHNFVVRCAWAATSGDLGALAREVPNASLVTL